MMAVLARQLYATRCSHKSVKARLIGNWYCCPRSVTTFMSYDTMKLVIASQQDSIMSIALYTAAAAVLVYSYSRCGTVSAC